MLPPPAWGYHTVMVNLCEILILKGDQVDLDVKYSDNNSDTPHVIHRLHTPTQKSEHTLQLLSPSISALPMICWITYLGKWIVILFHISYGYHTCFSSSTLSKYLYSHCAIYSIGSKGRFSDTSDKQSTRHLPRCFFRYSVSMVRLLKYIITVYSNCLLVVQLAWHHLSPLFVVWKQYLIKCV